MATFLAFPRLAYLICNLLAMGKTVHVGSRNKTNYYFRFATKLAKSDQYQLL